MRNPFAFVIFVPLVSAILATDVSPQPVPTLELFESVENVPIDVQQMSQRDLTSFPDMTRSRVVRINLNVIAQVFGAPPKPGESNSSENQPRRVDVDDRVGVGTKVLINFFDDQIIETIVDKSSSGTYVHGGGYHSLSLQQEDKISKRRFMSVTLGRDLLGNRNATLQYGREYSQPFFYSLRRLPGTPYFTLVERNRGLNHNGGSVIKPVISTRSQLPAELLGRGTGASAIVGPIVAHGLQGFSFGDTDVGYAIGSGAQLGHAPSAFKTLDGGKTWHDLKVQPNWIPMHIYFKNRNEGYLIIRRGGLLRTEDGGENWTQVQGTEGLIGAMAFDGQGIGYAFGWNRKNRSGWIWRSVDEGQSWAEWKELPNSKLGVHRIEVFGDELILLPSLGVYSISNGIKIIGRNGQFREPIYINYPGVRQVRFASRSVIFANTSDELGYYLIRSVDGGQTWSRIFEGQFGLAYVQSADEFGLLVSKGVTELSDTAMPVSVFAYTADGAQNWIEGPTTDLMPYIRDDMQKFKDGTETTLLGNNLLTVRPASK